MEYAKHGILGRLTEEARTVEPGLLPLFQEEGLPSRFEHAGWDYWSWSVTAAAVGASDDLQVLRCEDCLLIETLRGSRDCQTTELVSRLFAAV